MCGRLINLFFVATDVISSRYQVGMIENTISNGLVANTLIVIIYHKKHRHYNADVFTF
jgi:hypothetical protein